MTRVIEVLLVVVMMLAAAAQAVAQEKAPQLEEVVVTATKTQTPVAQTGSSVTVITRGEIERKQATDAVQILREQLGVSLIQTGTRGALNATIFTRGGNEDMNLVLVDGMKVNSGGGFFDFRDVTTAGVGRVEIVRGPQSALYGADAMTSVIQFLTPRGQGPVSAWLSAGVGNYDTDEERAGVSWGNQWAGVFLEADRVFTSGILPVNDEYKNHTGALRLDLSPVPDLDLTLTARLNEGRINFPTKNAGDRLSPLDPHQFADNERFVGTFTTRYRQTTWLEHRLKVGSHADSFFIRDGRDVRPEGTRSRTNEERLLLDYDAALTAPAVWAVTPRLVLGASYETQGFTSRSHPVTSPRTNVDREGHAAYGQLQLGVVDHVFLTGGVRHDASTVFGQEMTPRITAALVVPGVRTRVRGAWGTGIKEPSFGAEFGFPRFGIPANPTIKSEKSRSWEAGVDQPLFGGVLEVGATYFENHFTDLIALGAFAEGFKNIQAARSDGVEFVATLKPLDGWNASANYTFLETTVIDGGGVGGTLFPRGEPLLRRPKHSGSVSVGYRRDRIDAVLTLFVKGDSIDRDFSKPGSPRVTLGGYEKLDLSFAYTLFKDVVGLREIAWKTRFQNLLNERYEEVFGFSSPRLSALTGIEVRY